MGSTTVSSAPIEVGAFDVEATMRMQRLGLHDPTAEGSSKARFETRYASPNGVTRVVLVKSGGAVHVRADGDDAESALSEWLAALPPRDGYEEFAPTHRTLQRLHRERPGLRIVRVPWLFDIACKAILQQRIAFADAVRDFRRFVAAHGIRTPRGVAAPPASLVARMPTWQLEAVGIDPKRARAMIALAREEQRKSFLHARTSHDELRARLSSIRGIGPWTTELVLGFGAGDLDAVPTGDLHLPHLVSWALAREPRGSDARMLELLEPYRPHRFRVVRMLMQSGISPPRDRDPRPSGPRLPIR